MPVHMVESEADAAALFADGAGPVVVIPIYNAYEDAVQAVHSAFEYAPANTSFLLMNDGSTDVRISEFLTSLESTHRVVVWDDDENRGFVIRMNAAFAATGSHDVVLLNSDVVVGPEWLERLQAAAESDSRIGTVTPFTNRGTILSVPTRNTPNQLPPGLTIDDASRRVAANSAQLRPVIPTAIGHCTYIKRSVLDLVGTFDPVFSPGYGEEVDFSQRAIRVGFSHVCADDVYVFHRGRASFGESTERDALNLAHEQIIAQRYPYYHAWVSATAESEVSTLSTAIYQAQRALTGLNVLVDATSLGPVIAGTQRNVIETVRALCRHQAIEQVVALVQPVVPRYLGEVFADCGGLTIVKSNAVDDGVPMRVDVVYRPFQLSDPAAIDQLRGLGRRFVVSVLDLIAYNNPLYFAGPQQWEEFRDAMRLVLNAADGVAFNSDHVRDEAVHQSVLPDGKPVRVVFNGTDHWGHDGNGEVPVARPEWATDRVTEKGYVTVLGTDFWHKNRLFALKTFRNMRLQGYAGNMILAGPPVLHGSSAPEEARFLVDHPELKEHVTVVGSLSEREKNWLVQNSDLVLYPTLYEGFGLVPFEAARLGTPCLTSRQASLDEVLPADVEVIERWDAERVAAQAIEIIEDSARGERIVDLLEKQSSEYTWDAVVDALVELFDEVLRKPRSAVLGIEAEGGEALSFTHLPVWSNRQLPSPEIDALYPDEFREAMRAIGARPRLARPVISTTSAVYRVVSRVRTRVSPPEDDEPEDDQSGSGT